VGWWLGHEDDGASYDGRSWVAEPDQRGRSSGTQNSGMARQGGVSLLRRAECSAFTCRQDSLCEMLGQLQPKHMTAAAS
jgi:hypothetical protein